MFIFNVISKTLLMQMMKILHILLCHNLLLIKRKKRTGSKLVTIGYKNRNPSKISKKIKTYWNAVDIKCCWDLHKTQSPTSIVVLHQDDIFPISVHDSDGTRLHRQSWLRRHHSKISFRCIKLGLVYTVSSPLLHTGCRKCKI